MNKAKKTLLTTLGVLSLGAGISVVSKDGETKEACETYQGYTTIPEASIAYVFDSKRADERSKEPEYILIGNPNLAYNMLDGKTRIGKRFCFEYTEPESSVLGQDLGKLVSVGLDSSQIDSQ